MKEGRSKAGKSLVSKVNNGGIRNPIQEALITSTTRIDLPRFNQIIEEKVNWQLTKLNPSLRAHTEGL
jgi:hypothetical protein